MEVSKEMINRILQHHRPSRVHLQSAEVAYPNGADVKYGKGKGLFKLGESQYLKQWSHGTFVQELECLEQLSYVTFGQLISERKLSKLEDITLDQFLDLLENISIAKPELDPHKHINPDEPFYGEIEIIGCRRTNSSYITKIHFSLNDGAFIGELPYLLKL